MADESNKGAMNAHNPNAQECYFCEEVKECQVYHGFIDRVSRPLCAICWRDAEGMTGKSDAEYEQYLIENPDVFR